MLLGFSLFLFDQLSDVFRTFDYENWYETMTVCSLTDT